MADVFISYSRKDKPFLERLHAALKAQGRDIWVDWEDIPLTADWWREIATGIEGTDTFVFAITPDSLSSPVCMMEVDHAIRNNKRVIPVVHRMADEKEAFAALVERELDADMQARLNGRKIEDVARENWRTLSRHNWLMFREEDNFDENFHKLIEALETDLKHVKEHTRLLVRAREWDAKNRDNSGLLNGNEISEAEAWLAAGAAKTPLPTELHSAFIIASRQAATRRREQTIGALGIGIVLALGLAIFGLIQSNIANTQRAIANEALVTATNALGVAEVRGTQAADRAVEAEIARSTSEARGTVAADRAVEAEIARNDAYAQSTIAADRAIEALAARNEAYNQATIAADRAADAVEARSTSEARGTVAADRAVEAEIARNDAYEQGTLAAERAVEAEQARNIAYEQSTIAAERAIEAETNLRGSRENQSRFLADLSRQALEGGKPQTALLLALESLAYFDDFNIGDTTNLNALAAAINSFVQEVAYFPGGINIIDAAISDDYSRVIVWSNEDDGSQAVSVWNTDGTLINTLNEAAGYFDVSWNADFTRVLLTTADVYDLVQWDVDTDELWYWEDRYYYKVELSPNGQRAAALTSDLDHNPAWVLIDVDSGADLVTFDWMPEATVYPEFNPTSTRLSVIIYSGQNSLTALYDADGTLIRSLAADESVPFIRWTRDGQRLLVPTSQGRVYVYAANDGTTQLTLDMGSAVLDANWSADETQIITANQSGRVQVWDLRGSIRYSLPHTSAVTYAYPSTDNAYMLTAEFSRTLNIWDVAAENNFAVVELFSDLVDAAWNPSSTGFFALLTEGEIDVYTANGEYHTTIAQEDKIRAARWLDDTHLFTWGADGSARVWNLDSIPPGAVYHFGAVVGAAWNTDESRLLTWSDDGCACVWQDSELLLELWHDDAVFGAAWNADSTQILTWSNDGSVRTWDAHTGAEIMRVDLDTPARHAQWIDAGGVLVLWDEVNSDNGVVTLFNADGSVRAEIAPGEPLADVLWDAQGIVTAGGWDDSDGVVRFYDTAGQPKDFFVLPGAGMVQGVRWQPGQGRLFAWTSRGRGGIYAPDGTLERDMGRVGSVTAVDWTTDGSRLVVSAVDGYVFKVNLVTGETMFHIHGRHAAGAAWSPDDSQLLTWGNDGYARIWNGTDFLLLAHGADANVSSAAWSSDGRRILTTVESQLSVWDAISGDLIAEYGQNDWIIGAAWSANNQRILAWGYDGTARVWPLDLPTLIAAGESIRIRDLSPFELARAYLAAPISGIDQIVTPAGELPTPVPK